MDNNNVPTYGILQNVKMNIILSGLTEDALDKYQGSILAPSNYSSTNKFLFENSNLDGEYTKTYNGINSSINIVFVLKIANGVSQGSVSYISQHVFSSMPTYAGGSSFGRVTYNNGSKGTFNYKISLDKNTRTGQ